MNCPSSKANNPQISDPDLALCENTVLFLVFLLRRDCGFSEAGHVLLAPTAEQRPSPAGLSARMSAPQKPACLGRTPQSPASAAPGGAVDALSGFKGLLGRQSPAPRARWAPRRRSWWRLRTSRLASTDCSGGRTPKGPPTSTTLSVGAPPGEQPQRCLGGGDREGNAEGLRLIEYLHCTGLCAGHFSCLSLAATRGGRHGCSSAQMTRKESKGHLASDRPHLALQNPQHAAWGSLRSDFLLCPVRCGSDPDPRGGNH